ncbi:Transposon Ty3-I Gag-Pol polyprotein [Gossypium australe]|uniref:Transposon Ty3-I Gag-Pol polyprotein n=1 Tax=Gossypium australe TaxID=47621 RepID=A0A5B6WFG3_9ROSI|nr:Transposon Ty3-I Gag-Pol polyprotein [Gossypium australe]
MRSGKKLDNASAPIHKEEKLPEFVDKSMEEIESENLIEEVVEPIVELVTSKSSTPMVPFPSSFLNLFKSFNVNLPLLELIDKIPKYAKYLKEIMARHKKIIKGYILKWSFTILVEIGDKHFSKALCDLADRSLVRPKGVLEDVLVKLRGYIIPVDFVVLNFVEDQEIFVLLGRSFMATSKSTIDLEKYKLIMKIDGKIEAFKCGHNSQSGELLSSECFLLFDLIHNDLDQRYVHSYVSAGEYSLRNRDKWKDPNWYEFYWPQR